jgi:hypothetical protein
MQINGFFELKIKSEVIWKGVTFFCRGFVAGYCRFKVGKAARHFCFSSAYK